MSNGTSPRRNQTSIMLPADLRERLTGYGDTIGESMSTVVRMAALQFLDRVESEQRQRPEEE